MPFVEIAVPLGIPVSEPLVTARTLPAEERPATYILQTRDGEHWFSMNKTTGELTLHSKAQQRIAENTGTSVIKMYSARPLINYKLKYYFHGSTALVGLGPLIVEVSRSHSDTLRSVGLLRMSDWPDAETST
jgi:hypothetical protein